jgi:hypothetical protein
MNRLEADTTVGAHLPHGAVAARRFAGRRFSLEAGFAQRKGVVAIAVVVVSQHCMPRHLQLCVVVHLYEGVSETRVVLRLQGTCSETETSLPRVRREDRRSAGLAGSNRACPAFGTAAFGTAHLIIAEVSTLMSC